MTTRPRVPRRIFRVTARGAARLVRVRGRYELVIYANRKDAVNKGVPPAVAKRLFSGTAASRSGCDWNYIDASGSTEDPAKWKFWFYCEKGPGCPGTCERRSFADPDVPSSHYEIDDRREVGTYSVMEDGRLYYCQCT